MRGTDPVCVPDTPCASQGFLSSVSAVLVEGVASSFSQVENGHGRTLKIYIKLFLNVLSDCIDHK